MPPLSAKKVYTTAPLHSVLRWLFLEPAQVPQLLTESPWRGLRVLAGVLLLAGIVIGAARAPAVWHDALDWTEWFGNEVGTVQVTAEGKLKWENPETMPYVTRHAGWRVEFLPAGGKPPEKFPETPEQQGIWISPDGILMAVRQGGNELVFGQELFADGKFFGVFEPQWVGVPVDRPLSRDEIAVPIRLLLGGFLLATIVGGWMQVCLYLAMFSIIPVMLRSPWAARGFGGIFSFYSFVSVPPLMAAAVYSACDLPGLDFGTVFIFGFFAYMLLMFWQAQRAGNPQNPTEDDDDV